PNAIECRAFTSWKYDHTLHWWCTVQIKFKVLCLAMPMLVSAWANASIQIYPSKGIFGLEQACRTDPSKYEANGSSIVCDFSQAIDNEVIRKQAEQLFVQGLKQNFGEQIVDTI